MRHVLLRLHPWEEDHAAEEELARALHARGLELTFALPQNRELVRDPARWRAALEAIAPPLHPLRPALPGRPGDQPQQVGDLERRRVRARWRARRRRSSGRYRESSSSAPR